MTFSQIPFRTHVLAMTVVVAALVSGCQPPEQIHSYPVAKETKPPVARAEPATAPGEPTDRMLAAILPTGGQAWFFKVVGPIAAVDKHGKELNDFFAAVRVGDDGKPKWQLPSGWKEAPGNAMRLATIVVPTDGKPLEITVNALPWSGTPADMLSNVNRWRGQLQLPPIEAPQVAESTHEIKAGDRPMTIVDLRGRFAGSGMTPPFAGASANPPAPDAASNLPAGHPPIDGGTSAQTTNNAPPATSAPANQPSDAPKFAAPSDWQPLPATGMRKAAFALGDEQHHAVLTIIPFPATEGLKIADPLENVNRWRREVGLAEVKQDELGKTTESVEIDGKPATFVKAIPDALQSDQSQSNLATLAAMVKSGDQVWFIKLHGDRTVVSGQENAFKNFLKSLRFAGGGGATDGNN